MVCDGGMRVRLVSSFQIPSIDPGLAIGASGILLAIVQLWLGKQKERFDNTMELMRRLESDSARSARLRVRQIMSDAERLEYDFAKIDDSDRSALVGIGHLYGLAGLLIRRKRVDRDLFLQAYGNSLRVNYERLKPYLQWRDERFGGSSTLWREFDWLVARTPKYKAAGSQIAKEPAEASAADRT